MINAILELLATFIIWLISSLGYAGIVLAMAIESASIPLPSEIIMPFSGFLVSTGQFNFWWVTIAGGFGCLFGSWAAYALGYFGGESLVRKVIKKYGKYVLVFEYELDEAKEWFKKYGATIAFTSRLLPVVRTFISLPAGISKMNFKAFSIYSLVGSLIWSGILAYFGKIMGENWNSLGTYFHKFDFIIVILGILTVLWYIRHKIKKVRKYKSKKS